MKVLPTEELWAEDFIAQKFVQMTLSELTQAVRDGRFYCATLRGDRTGSVYPASQFVHPVPDLLPEVLQLLRQNRERFVHARMVTQEETLNDLAPAEFLAGISFSGNQALHPSQRLMLRLPSEERLALVITCLRASRRQDVIG